MRLILDLMGAPEKSGGMNLYAVELVRGWHDLADHDQLIVVAGTWAERAFADLDRVKVRTAPDRGIVGRSLSQLVLTAAVFWVTRADVVVSASPIVTPLVPRASRVCVVHDWRHLKNPQEFSRAQRLYRRMWRASVRWAGAVAVISSKTARETLMVNPGVSPTVVENGRDHPRRWLPQQRHDQRASVVTFGHHPNKRPELVIEAFAQTHVLRHADATLTVLGARGAYAKDLEDRARDLGISGAVALPGFVEPDAYEGLIANADVVVLASSDEGFGLPVAEAQFFGVPVVATSDSGLGDLHADLVIAEPVASSVARALETALDAGSHDAAQHPRTWMQVAADLRQVVVLLRSGADARSTEGVL